MQPDRGFAGIPVDPDLDHIEADVAIVGVPHRLAVPAAGRDGRMRDGPGGGPLAARSGMTRFRDHWDFDLDGPMLRADGPRSSMSATCPATRPTARATRRCTTAAVAADPRPRGRADLHRR